MVNKDDVINALKEIKDPEIGYSIVDLGFISNVIIDEKRKSITVKLVLTTPMCPLISLIFSEVEEKLKRKFEKWKVIVEYDFDKVWSPELMDKELRKKLGI